MNSTHQTWHETLPLAQPLRTVRLAAGPNPSPQAELEERLRTRYEEGLRDGEKALREQLLQQRSDLLSLQQGVLHSLQQTLPAVRAECEATLVELALEVAQKLVAGMPVSQELLEAAISEALSQVEEAHDVVVRLHAEDLALLQRVNAPVLLAVVGGEKVRFELSGEVSRGGCLVHTRFGVLDARRESKFELLRKSLQS